MTAVVELDDVTSEAPVVRSKRRAPRPARPRRPAPARRPLGDQRLAVLVGLVVLLGLVGWLVLHTVALDALSQGRAQDVLRSQLREQLAGQTAPLGTTEPGKPVALLRIPTLGLEQVVVEGTASGDLRSGPGHRRDTVLPGQKGVSVLFGKSLTSGAPFRSIGTLVPGDGIEVTTAQGVFLYRVDGVRRAGDPIPTSPVRLTLVTADVESLMPNGVVYVDATLQQDPAIGTGRVGKVPEPEKEMGIDPGCLPLLSLSLAFLVAGVAGVAALWRRLPAGVLWTLGAPVVVAGLWAVGAQVGRLLPNLL